MRSFLRADPDVIMVGEMRDEETAAIAIEASLTGHLVLSTLHTNTAPETVSRLLNMGVNVFNFSDSLLGVLAQRLVRTLCKECKEPYAPNQQELDELATGYGKQMADELNLADPDLRLYCPRGCENCRHKGYQGRMGLHELMLVTPGVREMIVDRAPIEDLRKQASLDGMRSLRQDGIKKILQGAIDLKEVRAATAK